MHGAGVRGPQLCFKTHLHEGQQTMSNGEGVQADDGGLFLALSRRTEVEVNICNPFDASTVQIMH